MSIMVKKYLDLKTLFFAFLLYNKSKQANMSELEYYADINTEVTDFEGDCNYFTTFERSLQILKNDFHIDYKVNRAKCYFERYNNFETLPEDVLEYYELGHYDFDSCEIEITNLEIFQSFYEDYIQKSCCGSLTGRQLNHIHRQNKDFVDIVTTKSSTSGSDEIYFSFDEIKNYYENYKMNFLELLQEKIDKKEFKLTGDILGLKNYGGRLPYNFQSITINGIPRLNEYETVYRIQFTKEPLKVTLNGHSMLDKKICPLSTYQKKSLLIFAKLHTKIIH